MGGWEAARHTAEEVGVVAAGGKQQKENEGDWDEQAEKGKGDWLHLY